MSPCLDFPRSCDILFLAGAFSALSRVLSVRCRAVARGRLLFLHHIKTARADLRAGGKLVKKASQSLPPAGGKKSEIIFSRDMCVRENTSQAVTDSQADHQDCKSDESDPSITLLHSGSHLPALLHRSVHFLHFPVSRPPRKKAGFLLSS